MDGKSPMHLDFESLTEQIVSTYQDESGINFIDVQNLPMRERIVHILNLLLELLFPDQDRVLQKGMFLEIRELTRSWLNY